MTDNEYLPGNEVADATFLMIEFEMFGKNKVQWSPEVIKIEGNN